MLPKKEYTAWTVVFEVFALLLPAYIAFKIVRIVQKWDMYIEDGIEQLAIIFYIAAGVGILVRGTLLIIVERVRKNFNKGLWRQGRPLPLSDQSHEVQLQKRGEVSAADLPPNCQ
eukprot:scpid76213/ scgid27864/ 